MEISTNTAHFTPTIYECEFCCITCNKISDWKRHIMTKKHFVNKAHLKKKVLDEPLSKHRYIFGYLAFFNSPSIISIRDEK